MKRILPWIFAVLAVGCGEAPTDGPPKIEYGRDECSRCGMIINDERYAGALVAEIDGQTRAFLFDDIGEQASYEAEHPNITIKARYVHDHATRAWLAAEAARYLHLPDLQTPMGSGIVAYVAENAPPRLPEANGAVAMDWQAVRQLRSAQSAAK